MPLKISIEDLAKAKVHLGHRRAFWNPKMAPFVFTHREGISIINLEKTLEELERALKFLHDLTRKGGVVLFVGTKYQAADLIEKYASLCGMPYINKRWPGGMLTNFESIKKNLEKIKKLEEFKESETFKNYTKREKAKITKELERLLEVFKGVRNLTSLPDALFIVDVVYEKNAVKEARELNIPIVAIVDTNGNPDLIDYPIPANDDSIESLSLLIPLISQAIKEEKKEEVITRKKEEKEEKMISDEELESESELIEEEIREEMEEEEGKKRIAKIGRDKES